MSVGARAGVIAVEAKVRNRLYKQIADQSCREVLKIQGYWSAAIGVVEDTIVRL